MSTHRTSPATPQGSHAVEEAYLAQWQATQQPVSLYLKNGICLQGIIVQADEQTLYLYYPDASQGQSPQQLVYKQAISSISTTPSLKKQANAMSPSGQEREKKQAQVQARR